MTDASKSTSTPTGRRGTATTAGTTGRGGTRRLESLTLDAEQALVARGLDIEVCVRMGLTSAVVHGTDDWIAIPTLRDGRPVRWKYRRVEKVEGVENFMQEPGGEQCVWNPAALTDETLRSEPLIITEGEFDAIAAIASGFGRVVSLPNGSTIPTGVQSSAWIDEILASVDATDQIIIAADDDEPGLKARSDLAVRLGAGRCKYLTYPRGCKDLNDALKLYGQRGVVESFNRARWCRVSGVFLMSELPPVPTEEPLHSGISGLGDHYRIRRGDLCVMTGIPGHGKSTFVNDLACRMVERHGWTVGFASFEQSPALDHKRALRTWYGNKPARQQSPDELAAADAWIDQHFAFIVPEDDDDASLDWVMERAASLVVRYGCQMIVIDPWNEIEHERPRDWTLTEYVNAAIRRFKRFAKKWNVHLVIVAHPTKLQRQSDGKMPIPNLYDISDCYSDDTEVLTKRGWLRHADVTLDDAVMCFDMPSGGSLWAPPSRIISQEYSGDMIQFKGAGFDVLVTPNHRMVVKPIWVDPVGSQSVTGIGRPTRWPKDKWSFIEAGELSDLQSPFKIPKAALAQDGDYPNRLIIHDRDYPAAEILELIGWWVAEGCFQSHGASLCQAEGCGAERIDELVQACGLEATRAIREDKRGFLPIVTWYFGAKKNKGFVEWLREKAGDGAKNKKIPYPIWNLHPYLKAAFLNGYIAGDGYRSKKNTSFTANTTSRQLYNDLQRMAVELGIPVCGHQRKTPNERHNDSYQVSFGTDLRGQVSLRAKRHASRVQYDGMIWCLTVPTGAYFIRRNGKVMISGNSAAWANKADIGVIVHRDEARSIIKVAKSRYHEEIGKPGQIEVTFSTFNNRFC